MSKTPVSSAWTSVLTTGVPSPVHLYSRLSDRLCLHGTAVFVAGGVRVM